MPSPASGVTTHCPGCGRNGRSSQASSAGADCHGCIETWLSGAGLARDLEHLTAERLSAEAIVRRAEAGEERAAATLSRYEDRLARALAHVINLLDPDVIVLGGGVSRVERLYRTVPALWDQWVFSDRVDTKLVPALHGDSSGVRGAAFLPTGIHPRG